MAYLTCLYTLLAMIQLKIMLAQLSRDPPLCGVAVFALQAKEPGMDLGFCMALVAGCRGTLENPTLL
jgi:hypothetical protein